MALSLSAPRTTELKPRIVVFGVGGAGGNAVNNMIEAGLEGVEFVVANTDAQQLQFAKTERRIQLGVQVTQGLGAGAHPEVGMSAAEESIPESTATYTVTVNDDSTVITVTASANSRMSSASESARVASRLASQATTTRFTVRGMSLANLRNGARETLAVSVGGGTQAEHQAQGP